MASAFINVSEEEMSQYYDDFMNEDVIVEEYESDAFSDGEGEDEDDLVFFLADSDDDEEEDDHVIEVCKVHEIKPLSESTREAMKVLDGKLKWAEENFETADIARTDEEKAEFPLIGERKSEKQKRTPHEMKRRSPEKKKRTPMKIRVNFVSEREQSGLRFYKKNVDTQHKDTQHKDIVCKFVLRKEDCPYGDRCIFSHTIPLCNIMKAGKICARGTACRYAHIQTCKDAPRCRNKKCELFHPKKEDLQKIRGMKLRYCRSILQKGTCEYKENCKFAHTKEEVKNAAEQCTYADCKLVRTARITKKGVKIDVYKNTSEDRCCWRLHRNEHINNFIARTSMTALVKK